MSVEARQLACQLAELASTGDDDPWLLPEDGVTDYCAIDTAVCGCRPVRLTKSERILAATILVDNGATISTVCRHLSLPVHTELRWKDREPHLRLVSYDRFADM